MKQVHMPPGFGFTAKPHVLYKDGQWWAVWPANVFVSPEMVAPFTSWLRKVNGIRDPRPTSFCIDQHERVQ